MPRDASPESATPRRSARSSLEWTLPAMIVALLLLVIAGYGSAAYREAQGSAVLAARDRLDRMVQRLADLSAASLARRASGLRALAARPEIAAALRGAPDSATDSAAALVLRREAEPTDSTFATWVLRTRAGSSRLVLGEPLPARDREMLERTIRAARGGTDSVRLSPLYASAGRVLIWSVAPVRDRGTTLGYLAERRRLANSPRADQDIRALVGQDISVYFTSRSTGLWTTLVGLPLAPPFTGTPQSRVFQASSGSERMTLFGAQASVGSTPWTIVLTLPRDAVLERPRSFLRRMLGIGLLLLLLGAAGAWALSRSVTRPLGRLTRAAEAVAGGDFGQRVMVARSDELGQLARTFNVMASRIGESHAELGLRLAQTAALASELEERNAALERAQSAADEARQAAQAASAAKSTFLTMMSHELRTPLNAIGGYAELMALGIRGPVTAEQREDLERVRRNQQHLLTIIDDMLNLSRIEAGQFAVTLTDVPVRATLEAVEVLIAPQMSQKGLRYVVTPCGSPMAVRADPARLQQVLLNLVSNAVRFTDPGGTVAVGCSAGPDRVFLSVRDTGIGIPPEKHEAIFEPFVQVDDTLTRRAGGTGLGLAISRKLAVAMGGDITVESEPGHGSTFTLSLARSRREARQTTTAPRATVP